MIEPENAEILILKEEAAEAAVNLIKPGMVVGLGSGTTTLQAIHQIADKLKMGRLKDILGIPTSLVVEREARRLGIPLTTLEDHPFIDLTIDGADEVDPGLNLIKGHGGAMLREKIVAISSRREVIIIDDRKLSPKLGSLAPVPVEIVPFGIRSQMVFLQGLGAKTTLRQRENGSHFLTDQGNLVIDCFFGPIDHLEALAAQLKAQTGIVEHGIFLDKASDVFIASKTGVTHWKRNTSG